MSKKVIKPTRPPHDGNVINPMGFSDAFIFVTNNSDIVYKTTGNKAEFKSKAYISKKPERKSNNIQRIKE